MTSPLRLLLALALPDRVVPLFFCTNFCFDEKQICAMNAKGLMMEFKSPCYMINHNNCYGTTYETVNVGPCPRPPSEKTRTYHKINVKADKKTN